MQTRLTHHIQRLIQRNRFKLLLLATLLVLVIPAFSGDNFTAELVFFLQR